MGTTAEKGARVLQSIAEVQEGINNLGGSLTNQTPFKDFKAQLDNIYDVLPKTAFQTGTDITISNGLKAKLDFEKVYQEVEYIESSSTQFIDTGVKANSSLSIDIDYMTSGSTAYHSLFGSRTSSKFLYYLNADGSSNYFKKEFGYYNQYVKPTLDFETNNVKTKLLWNGNAFSLTNANGTYNGEATASTFSDGLNLYLFAFNDNGSAQRIGNTKIYSCKIKDNNTIIRDMIPCYRKSDNVIGMYDKVNGVFYTNVGTGTFTKGADVGSGFGDIAGIGQSSQDSTQGYNLLPPPFETAELNGIKLTNNGDGTYTLNGTSTDQALFWGTDFRSKNIYGGKFVGCPSNWSTAWGYCQIQYDDYTFSGEEKGSGVTLDNSKKIYRTALMIRSGITFTNTIIKPMVTNDTSKTYADFEKYSGGYSSPSPNWEQEIKYVRGKNLFDKNNANILNANLSNYTNISGGSPSNRTLYIPINPNVTYTISKMLSSILVIGTTTDIPTFNVAYSQRLDKSNTTSATITTGENAKYLLVWYYNSNSDTSVTEQQILDSIQIEEGTQATPYLPFNTIEETIGGKSLADFSTINYNVGNNATITRTNGRYTIKNDSENGNYDNCNFSTSSLNFKPNTTYTFSALIISTTNTNGSRVRCSADLSNTGNQIWGNDAQAGERSYVTFTTPSVITSAGNAIGLYPIGTGNEAVFDEIMLCEGTDTTYEPYAIPTSYQLSLGDYKFYGIGDYKDELVTDRSTGKWYKLGRIGLFDDSVNLGENGISESTVNMLTPALNITGGLTSEELGGMSMCNMLTTRIINNTGLNGTTNSKKIRVAVSTDYATTYSGVRQLLANIKLFYVVETPTLTEITDTGLINQLENWYNAQSIKETTIIESNGDLPMIIKVRALKST